MALAVGPETHAVIYDGDWNDAVYKASGKQMVEKGLLQARTKTNVCSAFAYP